MLKGKAEKDHRAPFSGPNGQYLVLRQSPPKRSHGPLRWPNVDFEVFLGTCALRDIPDAHIA